MSINISLLSEQLMQKHLIWSTFSPCGTVLSHFKNPVSRALAYVALPIDFVIQVAVAPVWTVYNEVKQCSKLSDYAFAAILSPFKAVTSVFLALFCQIIGPVGSIHRMKATWKLSYDELNHQYMKKWEWLGKPAQTPEFTNDDFRSAGGFDDFSITALNKAFSPYKDRFEKVFINRSSAFIFAVEGFFHSYRNELESQGCYNPDKYLGIIIYPNCKRSDLNPGLTMKRNDEKDGPRYNIRFPAFDQTNLLFYGILPKCAEDYLATVETKTG